MDNKVILIIKDGFGASSYEEGNAVLKAKTPVLDYVWGNFSKTLLRASGEEVGLSWGEIGNSEVGHINIGTGRVTMQDLPRINQSILDKSFFESKNLIDACEWSKKNHSTLHLVGLISTGGVHAELNHLLALLELAKKQNVKKVAIHVFTDGRDMPKRSSIELLNRLDKKINELKIGTLATIIGRYYAMDRDNNWDRIEKAYDLMVLAKGEKFDSYQSGILKKYKLGEDDENLSSIVLDDKNRILDNDAMIFFNFRSDRVKQISETFINPNFSKFKRNNYPKNMRFVSFVSYGNEQTPLVDVAYVSENKRGQLAEVISLANLKQLHIAETEKYAHVTYFFNGGVDKQYIKEKRIIVSSPKIKSYDLKPQMSAISVTKKFIKEYKTFKPSFSVINFANPDMVGHTGNFEATKKAIEIVDKLIGEIIFNCKDNNTSIIITADHGNSEQMINPITKEEDKMHTTNFVPFCLIDNSRVVNKTLTNKISYDDKLAFFSQEASGILSDIAPTVIDILDIKSSPLMTGTSLRKLI